jgi:predicted Zn-dependent protease
MSGSLTRLGLFAALLAGYGALQAVDASPAAAPRPIETASAITPSEKAQGAKAHPQLLAEFGGRYDGPQAAYVTQVGRRIAVQSSLSSQQGDFTISLLNSSVNNAFAVPGGYVYVTRQLLALMNDEAELAGVLGHEVGHVAAQHGKKRQSAATRNTILGVLGQVLVGQIAGDSNLGNLLQRGIGSGIQLLTLKYSRTQEYEADDLGVRYLARAGYDPAALSAMLASLAAQTALDGETGGNAGSVPEWASTHPDPASRVQRALQTARASGSAAKLRNRETFLRNLEGLVYGDDPAQGLVVDGAFVHPGLKLKFAIPAGHAVDNQADAVTVSGQSARLQFAMGSTAGGDLDAYVRAVFAGLAGQGANVAGLPTQRGTINGFAASSGRATLSNNQGSRFDVTVVAYALDGRTACHFVVVAPQGQGTGAFGPTIASLARMTDREAAAIRPRRIHLMTVRAGDTAASLAAQMAYPDRRLERFLVLNGLPAGARLTPGGRVKLVID